MEWLFAAHSISQRSFHDFSSPTHDRGYAGPEPLREHPRLLHPASLAFARHFNKSPELLGPEQIRAYQVYLTNEKKLATGSILIAIAALRFLYKITLKRNWSLEEVIPAPKKPQKLPVVLSPEEVLQFLNCVRSRKHRAILDHLLCRRPAHLGGHRAHPSRHRRQAHGHPCRAGQREKRSLRDALRRSSWRSCVPGGESRSPRTGSSQATSRAGTSREARLRASAR